MAWRAYDLQADPGPREVDAWSDASHVFITNRPPLRHRASGFVDRYRAVIRELSERGPTALVLVVDHAAPDERSAWFEDLRAEIPRLRYLVIGVVVPRSGLRARVDRAASLLRGSVLGALPAGGPGADAAIVVAHVHLSELALRHPARHGAFLLEEGFNRRRRPEMGRRRWLREVAAARTNHRRYRAVAADGRPAVVLNQHERRYFDRWFPDRSLHVVPLCVSPTTRPLGVDRHRTDPATVGCIGRLGDPRTVVPLVSVVQRSLEATDWRWVLVGSGPDDRLRALAAAWPDRVTVTDRVDDVRPWYAEVDAVLVPADRAVTGTKTTVLQAWAEGVPCVAARRSAASAGAVDGDDVLVYEGPAGAIDALGRAISDDDLRAALVAGGRRRAAELDCGTLAATIADLAVAGERTGR